MNFYELRLYYFTWLQKSWGVDDVFDYYPIANKYNKFYLLL